MGVESLRIPAACVAWLAGAVPDWLRFLRAAHDPQFAQSRKLNALVAENASTVFGRAHGFAVVRTIRDFQKATPIRAYDGLEGWIERMKGGEPGVLTAERVLMFEKTSGSSGAAKYIPYTASLRREFQAAIRAWMCDLHFHRPDLAMGPAYWCITPLARELEKTCGGIPIGFATDAEYFTPREQRLIGTLMAAPGAIAGLRSMDDALYATLRHLAQTPALRFISVWSPSFLTVLISALEKHGDRLLKNLREGVIRLPSGDAASAGVCAGLRADPERARVLERDLRPASLWPKLRVISCWADGASEVAWARVAPHFPGVEMQPKGLLATEGVTTFPFSGGEGGALAVTSHFYEFLPEGESEAALAHELEVGRRYSVILTTGGGLWRYDSGDVVEVTGWYGRIPRLRFVGRRDAVCDLVGEKLQAEFVGKVFEESRRAGAWSGGFAMLAPDESDRYTAFLEAADVAADFITQLDAALGSNPHYAYARRLGQLRAPRLFRIRSGAESAFLRRCTSLGQRAGAIKPVALHCEKGWEGIFDGAFERDLEGDAK